MTLQTLFATSSLALLPALLPALAVAQGAGGRPMSPDGQFGRVALRPIARQIIPFGISARHTASVYLPNADIGNHLTTDNAAMVIASTPVGSGVNGPLNADFGLQVSLVRSNLSASAVVGEMDAVNILTRNPNGDGSGLLVNSGTANGCGNLLEGLSQRYSTNFTTTIGGSYSIQLGEICTGATSGGAAYSDGVVITAQGGIVQNGLLIHTTVTGAYSGYPIEIKGNYGAADILSLTPKGSLNVAKDITSQGSIKALAGTISGAAVTATYYLQVTNFQTPASSSAACNTGQIEYDTNFEYVCVATNSWKRLALASF